MRPCQNRRLTRMERMAVTQNCRNQHAENRPLTHKFEVAQRLSPQKHDAITNPEGDLMRPKMPSVILTWHVVQKETTRCNCHKAALFGALSSDQLMLFTLSDHIIWRECMQRRTRSVSSTVPRYPDIASARSSTATYTRRDWL